MHQQALHIDEDVALFAHDLLAGVVTRRIPPNLDEVRQALGRILRDGDRADAVVQRIRNLIKKAPRSDEGVDIDAAIREVIELTRSEALKNGVLVRAELAGAYRRSGETGSNCSR